MKLFSQVGYDNVTLIMIASSAGVARTVLYRYFRSKREVLDAAILAATRQIMKDCKAEIAKRGKAADRLSMVCFHVADVLFEKKEFMSAIFDFVLSMVRAGEDMSPRIMRFTGGIKAVLSFCLKLIQSARPRGFMRFLSPAFSGLCLARSRIPRMSRCASPT